MNSQTDRAIKFYIHTLGCKVNQYETQAMREILLKSGFMECHAKEAADICIINTCAFIGEARDEAFNIISETGELKSKGKLK